MSDDVKFIDAESYQGKGEEKLTFRQLVLEYLRKIGNYSAVEFRGGYWEEKPHPNPHVNMTTKVYVPDTREVYSNAVDYLYDILYPHFDDEMRKAGEEAEKELDEAFNDNTVIVPPDREDEDMEEAMKYQRVFDRNDDKISYRQAKLCINRRLFRALSSFLFRQKYMEGKSFEEAI